MMVVGIAVSAAEPSGVWGTLKEAFASGSALAASKQDAGSNELVKAVIADFETSDGMSDVQNALRKRFAGAEPADCVQRSLDSLRKVGDSRCQGTWRCSCLQRLAARHRSESGTGLCGGVPFSVWVAYE